MSDRDRAARRGRRLGIIAFTIPVAGITAIWTAQIIRQVWFPDPGPPGPRPEVACRQAVLQLTSAVARARQAAAQEPGGERMALQRFRAALVPEWRGRTQVGSVCSGDKLAEDALERLDALRYAEEHAVRYEAVALAEQRRRTDAIARELSGAKSE